MLYEGYDTNSSTVAVAMVTAEVSKHSLSPVPVFALLIELLNCLMNLHFIVDFSF